MNINEEDKECFFKTIKDILLKIGYIVETDPFHSTTFLMDNTGIFIHYPCYYSEPENDLFWAVSISKVDEDHLGINEFKSANIDSLEIPESFEQDLNNLMKEYKLMCTELKKDKIQQDFM